MAHVSVFENRKVPAFTLFESVVAITVITVLIGLSTMIYSNVIVSENPLVFYKAKEEVKQQLELLHNEKSFISKVLVFEGYEVEQQVDFHQGNQQLYQITYVVTSGGKELFTENHLVASE